MHTLALFGGARSTQAFVRDLTPIAKSWRRTSKAVGGYWLGSFQLRQEDLTRTELLRAYLTWIGATIREHGPGGLLTWDGLVTELRLVAGGAEHMISLRPQWWHNNVKVIYRSIADGSRQTIAWSEDTDASNWYGEMQLLLSLGSTTSAAATALQGVHLAEHAWPSSQPINSVTFPRARQRYPDRLLVKCAGFWHTLDWLYQETSLTDQADNIVSTLAGNSEFVTAGRIETNTLSTYVEASPNPVRLGAAIADIVAQGDAALNLWKCGVYENQELVYEPRPTEVTYYDRGARLLDKLGAAVHPAMVKPGFLLYQSAAPVAVKRPGSTLVSADPHVGYVDQVEFIAPDTLRLRLYSEEETVLTLGEQIRHEIAWRPPAG